MIKNLKVLLILFLIPAFFSCKRPVDELVEALRFGDPDSVKELLQEGVELDAEAGQVQPLEIAINKKDEDLANLLIEAGADVNRVGSYGKTPLQFAFVQEMQDTMEKLILNGADVNIDIDYYSEFSDEYVKVRLSLWAVFKRKEEFLKLLIDHGLELNELDEDGETIIHEALDYEFSYEFIEYVLTHNIEIINTKDENYDMTPLSYSLFQGRGDVARLLLENGAEIFLDGPTDSVLYVQIADYWEDGYLEIADLLYEKGLPVDTDNFWALHAAALEGRYEFAEWLLEHGADPLKKDSLGQLPIDTSVMGREFTPDSSEPSTAQKELWKNQTKVEKLLLEYGSPDPDAHLKKLKE